MNPRAVFALGLLALLLTFGTAHGAQQAVLGSKLSVKDPQPAGDAASRQCSVLGKERTSSTTVVGNPTATGATITILTEGTVSGSQSYALPQALSAKGKPLWKATKIGFVYSEPTGINGPIKTVRISRSGSGSFRILAKGIAKASAIGRGQTGDFVRVSDRPNSDAPRGSLL